MANNNELEDVMQPTTTKTNSEPEGQEVIRQTETPKRVRKTGKTREKAAKFTARTYNSLKEKINKGKLDRAFRRYNKTHYKLHTAVQELSTLQQMQNEGANVTTNDLEIAAAKANYYSKKLARLGVNLLKPDIKKVKKYRVSRKIKVKNPKRLSKAAAKIIEWLNKPKMTVKSIAAGVAINSDLKSGTKKNIRNAVEGALFKESGEVNDIETAQRMVEGLYLNPNAENKKEEIKRLRTYLSDDGKAPLPGDELDMLGVSRKPTDVPPVEPTIDTKTPKIEDEMGKKEEEPVKTAEEPKTSSPIFEPKTGDEKKEEPNTPKRTLEDLFGKPKVQPAVEEKTTGTVVKEEPKVQPAVEEKKDAVAPAGTVVAEEKTTGTVVKEEPKVQPVVEEKKDEPSVVLDRREIDEVLNRYGKVADARVKHARGEITAEELAKAEADFNGFMDGKCAATKSTTNEEGAKTDVAVTGHPEIKTTPAPSRASVTGTPLATQMSLEEVRKLRENEDARNKGLVEIGAALTKKVAELKELNAKLLAERNTKEKLVTEWEDYADLVDSNNAQASVNAGMIADAETISANNDGLAREIDGYDSRIAAASDRVNALRR